jgi:hypothetical protein
MGGALMSLRCGCEDEGDDIVFGPVHWCTEDPQVRGRHGEPFSHVVEALRRAQSMTGQDFVLAPERPYEYVLSEDELQ